MSIKILKTGLLNTDLAPHMNKAINSFLEKFSPNASLTFGQFFDICLTAVKFS